MTAAISGRSTSSFASAWIIEPMTTAWYGLTPSGAVWDVPSLLRYVIGVLR